MRAGRHVCMNTAGTVPTPKAATASTVVTSTSAKGVPENAPSKLNLGQLAALVVGSIIGSGIFGLPQNMASGAGASAILIGWTVTGFGMLLLVRV